MIKSKVCYSCKEEKSVNDFYEIRKGVPRSYCKKCDIEKANKWNIENTEKKREIRRNHYYRNKEKISIQQKEYYIANKEKIVSRERNRRNLDPLKYSRRKREEVWKRFGGSYEIFYERLAKQNNCCAICKIEFSELVKPQFDHDHATMKPRGILCIRCNTNLPYIEDNNFLNNSILYLKEHSEVEDKELLR